MPTNNFEKCGRLLFNTKTCQANNPAVRQSAHDGKFAEILVQCDQYASGLEGVQQDGLVAGIGRPIVAPINLMPGLQQCIANEFRDARIQQNFQAASRMMNGSTRSCSASRWA